MSESLTDSNRGQTTSLTAHTSGALGFPVCPGSSRTCRIPKPGEENAPTFNPEKSEGLGRFFECMEDWFADEGIVDDLDKKRYIVKYLDPESESQWRALSKFQGGSFQEFQSQVMASYPKAEEFMTGSITALKRKIQGIGPVALKDRDELLTLIRIMTAEIWRLNQISPPIHSNRELVELFLNRLAPGFAIQLATKLSMQSLMNSRAPAYFAVAPRDPEDLYDIHYVLEMAKHISLEYASPLGKYLEAISTESQDKKEELEQAIESLKESMVSQAQYNKLVDERLMSLQSLVNSSMNLIEMNKAETVHVQSEIEGTINPGTFTMDSVPIFNDNEVLPDTLASCVQNTASPGNCHYCAKHGHKSWECKDALQHLKLGWIKRIGYQFRMPDGSKIPRYADMTMKLIIENLSKERKRSTPPGPNL